MIKILFFAALRERLQCGQLEFNLSSLTSNASASKTVTIAAVLAQLQAKDSLWQHALSQADLLCALNQQLVPTSTEVKANDELAFFPPVTGG